MNEGLYKFRDAAWAVIVEGAKALWLLLTVTIRSILNLSIEYFPRIRRGDRLDNLHGDNLVVELAAATQNYEKLALSDPETAKDAIEIAKSSLEEAKHQTEYQDDKASRLLTVTSFVSALSGVLLASFLSRYPLDQIDPFASGADLLLMSTYGCFFLFTICALFGAVVTFHATRTRFKYSKRPQAKDPDKQAKSLLFYQEIVAVSPKGWADSFVTHTPTKGSTAESTILRTDLQAALFRNYVMEAYLIAAKTADKVRYLGPAQSLLAWALRLLAIFVVLFAIAIVKIPERKAPPEPTRVEIAKLPWPMIIQAYPATAGALDAKTNCKR